MAEKRLAKYIDHTLLKPESTEKEIIILCEEAIKYGFATVCVHPFWVPIAADTLQHTDVGITAVIGFPLGVTSTLTKIAETKDVIASGATEVDMVMNVGALKSGNEEAVLADMRSVVNAAKHKAIVKVILETGLLTETEIERACKLAVEARVDFVKTSTGFGPGAATIENIRLMRKTVGPHIGVKASGGVRNAETAQAMIKAGATRIGASAGIAIVEGEQGEGY